MIVSKVVRDEVDRLISKGLLPKEHRRTAKLTLERELRRRTNNIVTDIARKVGTMYLLKALGSR